MAKALPSAQDLGVVTPQPSLGVASYKGATGMEDDAARGTLVAAQGFERVAQHLEKAQERFDNLQAEDRFNQYQERLNQIAFDPNDGWSTAKGENAIKPEFNTKYSQRFDDERNKLLEGLESQGAKRRFAQLSASAAMRSRAALYEHSAKERVAYGAKVTEDSLKAIEADAWRTFGDDARFNAHLERARFLVSDFAREWSTGAPEETVKRAVQEIESRLWKHRIGAAVAAGDTRIARDLMGKATGVLTTADKMDLDQKIKPQLKIAEAQEKVEELFTKMVPKDPNAPFPALELDAALRKEFAGDPQSLQMARQELGYRRGQVEIQQRESNNANIGTVMEAFYQKNVSLPNVMRMPEFQALQGDAKARVMMQMEGTINQRVSRAHVQEGRALQAMQRRELELKLNGMETYLRLRMDPEAVSKMTPNDLKGIAAQIGWDHTQSLVSYHQQLQSPKGQAAAKLTSDAFRGIVNDYLTEDQRKLLASSPKTDGDRMRKHDLQRQIGEANLLVNTAIQNRKATTLEEATDIARTELGKTLRMKETGFLMFGKPEQEIRPLLSPKLAPEDVKRLYVPLPEIPQEDVLKTIASLRKHKPGLSGMTDGQILTRYKGLIESVHGRLQGGVPPEQVLNYLRTERD
jgi:hypothetical protein